MNLRITGLVCFGFLLTASAASQSKLDSGYYRSTAEWKAMPAEDQKKVEQVLHDLRAVEKAMDEHRKHHGKIAAKLDDLVPKYLPAVPKDPFSTSETRKKTREELQMNRYANPTLNGQGYWFFSDPEEGAWIMSSVGGKQLPLVPRNLGLNVAGGFWSGGTYVKSITPKQTRPTSETTHSAARNN